MKFKATALALVLTLPMAGCLQQSQFFGSYSEGGEISLGTQQYDGMDVDLTQFILTDYDFWGDRPGGFKFYVHVRNTGPRAGCFYTEFKIAGRTDIRSLDNLRGRIVEPGERRVVGVIHMRDDDDYPEFIVHRAGSTAWREADGEFAKMCEVDCVTPQVY